MTRVGAQIQLTRVKDASSLSHVRALWSEATEGQRTAMTPIVERSTMWLSQASGIGTTARFGLR